MDQSRTQKFITADVVYYSVFIPSWLKTVHSDNVSVLIAAIGRDLTQVRTGGQRTAFKIQSCGDIL